MSGDSSRRRSVARNSARLLRLVFERSGYVRVKEDRGRGSHHGVELRLAVRDKSEARAVRSASAVLGLKPGRTFAKWNREVLPFYGRRQVERFLAAVKPGMKLPAPARDGRARKR
jgi:hypothetical protein